jgi:hypothetical protein
MSLTAEQRRALIMLAASGQNGVPQRLLSAHGLNAATIRRLVNRGLAITTRENIRADERLVLQSHKEEYLIEITRFFKNESSLKNPIISTTTSNH